MDQNPVIRLLAKIFSYLFHPLFIAAYVTVLLLWLEPVNKLLISNSNKPRMLAMVILYTIIFPAFSVFLLWRLQFIKSIYLHTQKERIIPLVTSMFFFFWIYYVSRNLEYFPLSLKNLFLGIFLSSAIALFVNAFNKISMHGLAMGGLVSFFFIQQFTDAYWNPYWSIIALIIAGMVCSSRLILKAHRSLEIYLGVFMGSACQVIAYFVLPYFGYTVNTGYFHESKDSCQEKLAQCQKDLIKSGLDGAKETCD